MRKTVVFLIAFLLLSFSERSVAEEEMRTGSSGLYVGVETGLAMAPEMKLKSIQNNAIAHTTCDLHFAGETGFVKEAKDYRSFEYAQGKKCGDPVEDFWFDEFDESSVGLTTGLVVGYRRLGGLPLRAEIEYFYRNNEYGAVSGQSPQTETAASKDVEFIAAFGKLKDVQMHNLFFNVYYDFENGSKFTPYLGLGGGWARATHGIRQYYQRGYEANVPEAVQGRVSALDDSFRDDLLGFQVITGLDYWLTSKVSAGLKLRGVRFDKFVSDKGAWRTLRGHASTKSPDELVEAAGITDNRILYSAETDDTSFWGGAISLKYHF